MMVSGLAVLLALVAASSAFAFTTSTTGASGRITTPTTDPCGFQIMCLWATDTSSSDTYCARWQAYIPGYGGWNWIADPNCSSVEKKVAWSVPDGNYRICRTGAGNCGPNISVVMGLAIRGQD